MFKFFSNFISKPSASVLGIDVGSSSIKVVQLHRQNGRAVLDTYGELALGPYSGGGVGESTNLPPEKIIEALSDLLKENEVKITTRSCGIAIPFSASLMSIIEMPLVSVKQLDVMIPIEARKYVPVPISEVSLDWSVIPKDKTEGDRDNNETQNSTDKMEVLIVAIHNDTIARYKNIIEKSVLNASFFEIEIFSTMRSVLEEEMAPIMLLDMGATTTKLYIVERGILRGSHTINRGSQSITNTISKALGISLNDAELLKRDKGLLGVANGVGLKDVITTTLDYIFTEANHIILSYQQKYNKNVSKVILVGGGSSLKGVVDVAKKSFQTEIISGNPFSKVVVPAFLETILRETGPEFTVAVGLALRKLQETE